MFNSSGTAFLGPQPFALDRTRCSTAPPATIISTGMRCTRRTTSSCRPTSTGRTSRLRARRTRSPRSARLRPGSCWRFHVDFVQPGRIDLHPRRQPRPRRRSASSAAAGSCVPQAGTGDTLDTLRRPQHVPNAYRRFTRRPRGAGREHDGRVERGRGHPLVRDQQRHLGLAGLRQQSTYQPDNTWRWMGSAAMDASATSPSASAPRPPASTRRSATRDGWPATRRTRWRRARQHLFAGTGSQTDTVSRWGDYCDITVDPIDDCTFWYTQEYYAVTPASTGGRGSGASSSRTASPRPTARSTARSPTRQRTLRSPAPRSTSLRSGPRR